MAVDKFLQIAWNKNKLNGQANFDIDDDLGKQQRHLFDNKLTKIEEFQSKLEKKILSSDKISNKDVYDFTIECGHIPVHATDLLKKLKREKKISYSGHTRVNYNSCYKNNNIVIYKVNQ